MATQPAGWKGENTSLLPARLLHLPLRSPALPARRDTASARRHGWRKAAHPAEGAYFPEAPACASGSGRQNLLVSLFPLVRRMALKMRSHLPPSVEVDDLVGAGALGLLDAVDKFDPLKHTKLETYARHRIRGSMLDSLRALDSVSRSVRRKSRKIEKLYRELGNRFGRSASDEEIGDALGLDLREWHRILGKLQAVAKEGDFPGRCPARAGAGARHLTGRSGEDSDAPYRTVRGDGAADLAGGGEGPFELLLRRELREFLNRALANLPARVREVMTLYYRDELTMAQIAAKLGLDESRISQIRSQALARLRRHMQALLRLSQPVHATDSSNHIAIDSLPPQPLARSLH